ncbi:MAG: hypothetical protein QE271_02325 [Bacteriovoracaceae bacterium]|nr:hypothetical protein [Bacteriovoracaceae bacterium]
MFRLKGFSFLVLCSIFFSSLSLHAQKVKVSKGGDGGGHSGDETEGDYNEAKIEGTFSFEQMKNQTTNCLSILGKKFIYQFTHNDPKIKKIKILKEYTYGWEGSTTDLNNLRVYNLESSVGFNVSTKERNDQHKRPSLAFVFRVSRHEEKVLGISVNRIMQSPRLSKEFNDDGVGFELAGDVRFPRYEFKKVKGIIETNERGAVTSGISYTDIHVANRPKKDGPDDFDLVAVIDEVSSNVSLTLPLKEYADCLMGLK